MTHTDIQPAADLEPPAAAQNILIKRFLVALDASDHAGRALDEAMRLAGPAAGSITGIHAYAAQLHDRRFRQMEGGLPERYLVEEEMTHQRNVHDDLITKGLNIISDSYHDVAAVACENADLPYERLSPEGKNYACVVDAAQTGAHDVLVLGALGLGAVPGSVIGTVCERVARRSPIDTLVIKDPDLAIGDGPIVVGMDGSDLANGALLTAIEIARRVGARVHVVAAYDPYYHYVAFNTIAGVLSEEAGKVFRFKEQEQLHEELIDDGIAKIYQSHLEVAQRTAAEKGVTVTTKLLDGKPFRAILDYVGKVKASLLIVGKTGVHADQRLDIGGNTENLLRLSKCHLWLTQAGHTPDSEVVAEETISWSNESLVMLGRAPSFVQAIARKAVMRHAQKLGHTFITSDIVSEVMGKMMPGRGATAAGDFEPLNWSEAALALLDTVTPHLISAMRLRADKRARRDGASEVLPVHIAAFLETGAVATVTWTAAALARLSRSPEMVRDRIRADIEDAAQERGLAEIELDFAEEIITELRKAMCPVPEADETEPGAGEAE